MAERRGRRTRSRPACMSAPTAGPGTRWRRGCAWVSRRPGGSGGPAGPGDHRRRRRGRHVAGGSRGRRPARRPGHDRAVRRGGGVAAGPAGRAARGAVSRARAPRGVSPPRWSRRPCRSGGQVGSVGDDRAAGRGGLEDVARSSSGRSGSSGTSTAPTRHIAKATTTAAGRWAGQRHAVAGRHAVSQSRGDTVDQVVAAPSPGRPADRTATRSGKSRAASSRKRVSATAGSGRSRGPRAGSSDSQGRPHARRVGHARRGRSRHVPFGPVRRPAVYRRCPAPRPARGARSRPASPPVDAALAPFLDLALPRSPRCIPH